MRRDLFRLFLSFCLAVSLSLLGAAPANAACDPDGRQASGAVYRICMPAPGQWNGKLVVWAHGYVAFNEPVAIPEDQLRLPDGTSLPDLVNSLGYAFATTSYSVNGLAVRQGLADVVDLVSIFTAARGPARRVYLVGASEGGLITTLAVERRPDVFSGGLATCGPIGSWPRQIQYVGDARVLFDYFYPGLLPGGPTWIPPELIASWPTHYATAIRPVVFAPANQGRTRELLRTARLPADVARFWPTAERSIHDVLWFNVFGTNDALPKLGGQPFDNMRRVYVGSSNDLLLNFSVDRFAADAAALAEMRAHYDTRGVLRRPLVTLHTTHDQQVPYWHEVLYTAKVVASGSLASFASLPVSRYGHCNFTPPEVLAAFGLLVFKTEGLTLSNVARALGDSRKVAEFDRLAAQHGLPRGGPRRAVR